MTRPRPTPRSRENKVTQKSDIERLVGVADKPEVEVKTLDAVTHLGYKFRRSTTPIGFEAAQACKSGIGMESVPEGGDVA